MELRERLAEYAHEAWSGWVEYLFRISQPHAPDVIIPAWAADRWARQMNTPYNGLPDGERDNDRKEADRILEITGVAEKDKRIAELEERLEKFADLKEKMDDLERTLPDGYDIGDDATVELAIELSEAQKRIAKLEAEVQRWKEMSPSHYFR